MKKIMDTQRTEILGDLAVKKSLTLGGVEIATPSRDRGVDLVAYLDDAPGGFVARPLQLKVSSGRAFSLDRKYEKIPALLLTYVWNVGTADPVEIFAMTYWEAFEICAAHKWTLTPSWREQGRWRVPAVGEDLLEQLRPYRMEPDSWPRRLAQPQMGRRARGVEPTWLSDSFAPQSMSVDELDPYSGTYFGPRIGELLALRGGSVGVVVLGHTEGLGPNLVAGKFIGLCDLASRPYGRARPSPALLIKSSNRTIAVPLGLVLDFNRLEEFRDSVLPGLYDFGALTPGDDVTSSEYIALYPHS